MNIRQLFQNHLAQTSPEPVALHIASAKGNYLTDINGKQYLDLIGGISVCNVGHCHPKVVDAIKMQADEYLHIMVYGELIQTPQISFAQKIINQLPAQLNSVYFTNSGTEACEAALKLSHRITGRPNIIAANNSYHGHTMGALSVMGSEYWRNAFRPLLPGVGHYDYNSQAMIDAIDKDTACVLIESVQSEAGIITPDMDWIKALRQKCNDTCTLLIMDEIQTGFGRTGKMWGFQHTAIIPDMILLGKALGGGMPMGALVTSTQMMNCFTHNPVLGHMTTFGGHPVCCAAGEAAIDVLIEENLTHLVTAKEALFHKLLVHPEIKAIRSKGLLMAIELSDNKKVLQTLSKCLEEGLFSDWFLFADNCIRVAPPLTITLPEIEMASQKLLHCLS